MEEERSSHARSNRALHKAVVSVLARALECCLDPPLDFRNPQWWFGSVDRMLRVYDREGLACWRCGRKIRRAEQEARRLIFARIASDRE